MNPGKILEYVLATLLVVLIVSLAFSYLLGQPAILAFVETGSMEPTLNAGDGFVAIPAAIAGDVEQGDVVTFDAEQIEGGGLTTHEVVGERDTGYITQGEDNPVTDQDGGEPPVTDGQIKAVALQVNGEVVRIPHLGTAVMGIQDGIASVERTVAGLFGWRSIGTEQWTYLLFGLGVVLFGASFLGGEGRHGRSESRDRSRSRAGVVDSRLLLAGCIALLCIAATMAMVMPAGTQTYDIVSTEGDSADPTIIPVGETDDFEYVAHNPGFVPTVSHFEPRSGGIEIDPDRTELSANETANLTVTLHADSTTGLHIESMTEYRYLAVLPPSVIDALYRVHPWAPYPAIYLVIATPLVVLWTVFGGTSGKVRLRSRSRSDGVFGWL